MSTNTFLDSFAIPYKSWGALALDWLFSFLFMSLIPILIGALVIIAEQINGGSWIPPESFTIAYQAITVIIIIKIANLVASTLAKEFGFIYNLQKNLEDRFKKKG